MAEPAHPFDKFQDGALSTAIYRPDDALAYTTLGLCGEVGEIASKVGRWNLAGSQEDREDATAELGDVCYFIASLAHVFSAKLSELQGGIGCLALAVRYGDLGVLTVAMAAAAGEIANKSGKVIRDNRPLEAVRPHQIEKLRILLALVDAFATRAGTTLAAVMTANSEKLQSRMARGVLSGDGDYR